MREFIKSNTFNVCVTLILVGAAILFFGIKNGGSLMKPAVDIYSDSFTLDQLEEGTHIKSGFYASAGIAAELETNTKRNGKTSSIDYDYYHMVPIVLSDSDAAYWVAVKVSENNEEEWDNLVDITYAHMSGDDTDWGIHLEKEGIGYETGSELYSYMTSYLVDLGMFESNDEAENYVLPYYIDTEKDTAFLYKMVGTGLGMIVLALLLAAIKMHSINKKKAEEEAPAEASFDPAM